jgi:hypothetical protein
VSARWVRLPAETPARAAGRFSHLTVAMCFSYARSIIRDHLSSAPPRRRPARRTLSSAGALFGATHVYAHVRHTTHGRHRPQTLAPAPWAPPGSFQRDRHSYGKPELRNLPVGRHFADRLLRQVCSFDALPRRGFVQRLETPEKSASYRVPPPGITNASYPNSQRTSPDLAASTIDTGHEISTLTAADGGFRATASTAGIDISRRQG